MGISRVFPFSGIFTAVLRCFSCLLSHMPFQCFPSYSPFIPSALNADISVRIVRIRGDGIVPFLLSFAFGYYPNNGSRSRLPIAVNSSVLSHRAFLLIFCNPGAIFVLIFVNKHLLFLFIFEKSLFRCKILPVQSHYLYNIFSVTCFVTGRVLYNSFI